MFCIEDVYNLGEGEDETVSDPEEIFIGLSLQDLFSKETRCPGLALVCQRESFFET